MPMMFLSRVGSALPPSSTNREVNVLCMYVYHFNVEVRSFFPVGRVDE